MSNQDRVPSKIEYSEALRRKVRKDSWPEIGKSTFEKFRGAIREENNAEALELADYLRPEGKELHDLYCDWLYANMDYVAKNFGEAEIPKVLTSCHNTAIGGGYEKIAAMSVEDRVRDTVDMARAHRSGTGEAGDVVVREEEDRYVVVMNPCGDGGRQRRGGPDGALPRTGPPFNLGKTTKPYPWSWNKADVPYCCVRCCIWGELASIDALGYPWRITEYKDDPAEPCSFVFYKRPELIPEEYYARVGKVKGQ